jgi:hypothetical protein
VGKFLSKRITKAKELEAWLTSYSAFLVAWSSNSSPTKKKKKEKKPTRQPRTNVIINQN